MCGLTNYKMFGIFVAAASIIVSSLFEFCIKVAKHCGCKLVIQRISPCQNYGHCERNAAPGDCETCISVTLSAVKNTTRDIRKHLCKQRSSER